MRHLNRITPALPAHAMTTYRVLAPPITHFRAASCAEVNCPQLEHGWRTVIDETTALGRQQASYIRGESGRRFREAKDAGALTVFVFEAGQRCFQEHRVRLDRQEIYVVHDGDWRGNPRGTPLRRHANAADWVDDFATHQQTLADRLKRG